ncbi:MAG: hypothetical protein A3J28_08225 [Acidobacteria bacterium RIFCSPLOWO2_12_FULL_60_22]|nr:MAG: hypothetical protein A3J28_08225 [Acidobacteria bacterium RIFCSPLOWO2_12_FULL_60_22]
MIGVRRTLQNLEHARRGRGPDADVAIAQLHCLRRSQDLTPVIFVKMPLVAGIAALDREQRPDQLLLQKPAGEVGVGGEGFCQHPAELVWGEGGVIGIRNSRFGIPELLSGDGSYEL